MSTVVLASPAADAGARAGLERALALQPGQIVRVATSERHRALREAAGDHAVAWIIVVDEDVIPVPDAFGALRRAFADKPALVGGRAIVENEQRFGAMFGPPRWGPSPYELEPFVAPGSAQEVAELVRGPIDVPQRGLIVIDADFLRGIDAELDPALLHFQLAVRARASGRVVFCEPRMTFSAAADPPEARRRLPAVMRASGDADWDPERLYRDPLNSRRKFIRREIRVSGNIRGYERRPYPRTTVLFAGGRGSPAKPEYATAGVIRCDTTAGGVLRELLAHTGERYLLVVLGAAPTAAEFATLVERLERSSRIALALDRERPPYQFALFHLGRVADAASFGGSSVAEVVAAAVDDLPVRRLFAAAPAGIIMPTPLPPIAGPRTVDVVILASGRPELTKQSIDGLLQSPVDGTLTTVFLAGATTTERTVSVWPEMRRIEDRSDPLLASGLNRALAESSADAVFIVRDDVMVPVGTIDRLRSAFARLPGLAVAGPRMGAEDRPEGLVDVAYRDLTEMRMHAARRAVLFARETPLVDLASVPALLVSRRAFDLVGGFDPTFGFSRYGIEDFVRRVRSANLGVARCDDAYVHLFRPEDSQSFVGALDTSPALRGIYERRWSGRDGFEPKRDFVSLTSAEPVAARPPDLSIVVPIADRAEWERALPALAGFVAEFRAGDPIELVIGLDGSFEMQTAVGALRELLTEASLPMEETLNVRVEKVTDVAVWRESVPSALRLAGAGREALETLPVVADAAAARTLLAAQTS